MKTIISLFLISISLHAAAQKETVKPQNLTPVQMKFKKARTYNTISWTVFGVGLTTVAISAASYPKDLPSYLFRTPTQEEIANRRKQDNAIKFALGGLVPIIASVPMILNSGYKVKKAKLLVRSESVSLGESIHSNLSIQKIGIAIDF